VTVLAADSLRVLVDQVRPWLGSDAVSTYLPELSRARSDELAVAVDLGRDGVITAGDHEATFTLQSVVKVFTLLLALHEHGKEHVFERVGCDQALGSYNSLETFVRGSGLPVNPFVNAGALVVVDMLPGGDPTSRIAHVLNFVRALAGNPEIRVNVETARSELMLADQNRALGYYLRSRHLVTTDIEDLLWAYCQMCAIEVDVVDLAHASRMLSDRSDITVAGEVIRASHLRLVRRLMLSTGMYEASGHYGPALDESANSLGGVRSMRLLSAVLEID
jgi:glutaminase